MYYLLMISYSGYILYEIRHVYSPCLIPTSDVIYMRKYDSISGDQFHPYNKEDESSVLFGSPQHVTASSEKDEK